MCQSANRRQKVSCVTVCCGYCRHFSTIHIALWASWPLLGVALYASFGYWHAYVSALGNGKRRSSLTRALSQAYGEHSCLQTIRRNADTVTTLKFAKPREVRARTFYMRTHTERKAVYVMTTRVCSNILQRTYSSIANKKSLHKSYLGLDKDCAERLSTSPRANIPLNPTESPWSIRH
jgi:hypothetical protein